MFTVLVWDDFWFLICSPALQPLYKCVLLPTAVLCYKHVLVFFPLHSAAKHHFGRIGVVHISMVHLTLYSKHSYAWESHLAEVLRQPVEQTISVLPFQQKQQASAMNVKRNIRNKINFYSGLWYFLALLLHPVSWSQAGILVPRFWLHAGALLRPETACGLNCVLARKE